MKYIVSGLVTISVHTEVEADSPGEARDKAEDRLMMNFCNECAGTEQAAYAWVTSGELDGTPRIELVEEVGEKKTP